jgi:hypothetical protein
MMNSKIRSVQKLIYACPATRYTLDVYALSATYPNVYQVKVLWRENDIITIETLWFNAAYGVEVPAACANVPTITPTPVATVIIIVTATPAATATPTVATGLTITCSTTQDTTFKPGVSITGPVDCKYLIEAFKNIQNPNDIAGLSAIFNKIQDPTHTNVGELKTLVEAFFNVRFEVEDEVNAPLTYQGMVNITLALTQTTYALSATANRDMYSTAQLFFDGLIFRKLKGTQGLTGAITGQATNGPISLYNTTDVQTPRNIVHEIGHFTECKLGSFGCGGPNYAAVGSIYGGIHRAELRAPNGDIISRFRDENHLETQIDWKRSKYGWGESYLDDKGWQQNPSYSDNPNSGTCTREYGVYATSQNRIGLAACVGVEEAADMFLNWVYDTAKEDVFSNDLYGHGLGRRAFMKTVMKSAIATLLQ